MPKRKRLYDQELRARLKRDAPYYYAQLQLDKYKNPRKFFTAARLKEIPDALDRLQQAWKAATEAERATFQRWITKLPPKSSRLVNQDGFLSERTRRRIARVMANRPDKPVPVRVELGYHPSDNCFDLALSKFHPWKPTDEFLERLSAWLEKHEVKRT